MTRQGLSMLEKYMFFQLRSTRISMGEKKTVSLLFEQIMYI